MPGGAVRFRADDDLRLARMQILNGRKLLVVLVDPATNKYQIGQDSVLRTTAR